MELFDFPEYGSPEFCQRFRQIVQFTCEENDRVIMEFLQDTLHDTIVYSVYNVESGSTATSGFHDLEVTLGTALEIICLPKSIEITFCQGNDSPNVENYLDTPIKDLPVSQFTVLRQPVVHLVG